jgi:hypothetical protein
MEEVIMKLLWCMTYASVIAGEKESMETAVLQANEAVTRYVDAWVAPARRGVQDGPE